MAGTEGATAPFWSPDSRSIGFFAAVTLLRLDLTAGAPQALATAVPGFSTGSWGADGTILFNRQSNEPLFRVAATGGESAAVTQVSPHQLGHRAPHVLPDGRHFLFYSAGTPDVAGLYLGSLDGGTAKRLTAADSGGGFLPPDRVLYVRQGTLVAHRLDLAGRALTGDPVTLADRVGVDGSARGSLGVSSAGTVAYRAGVNASRLLRWVDRTGKTVGVAIEADASAPQWPELSPDGRRVAVTRTVQGNSDIWMLDLVQGGMNRLTFDAASDGNPIWSPDGMRIAFSSFRTGVQDLYVRPADGSGTDSRMVETPYNKIAQDWSRDGRWLVYYEAHPTTGRSPWAVDLTSATRSPQVVANTPAEESLAALSPDGRWVAYQTNESGRYEVIVQPFPVANGKWQVSTAGGVAARWRSDGKELFFLAPDATLMAVPVTAAGTAFEAGTPTALFPTRVAGGGAAANNRPQYAVARDGRFLINQPAEEAIATPITLVLNWNPEQKQ